jgi:hypothetical protein
MYGTKELRAHLQKRLGISDRHMRRLIADKAAELPSTPQQALFVIAYEQRMRLKDYMTSEQIAEVRNLLQGRPSAAPPAARNGAAARQIKTSRTTVVREAKIGDVKVPPSSLSQKHVADAQQMATVYPVLYVLENAVREFVDGHLTKAYGASWWDEPGLVPKGVRDNVKKVRNAEAVNRAHTSRKARPIYYTMMGDLVNIVTSEKGNKVFKRPMFPRPTWFPELVHSAEITRNIFAHMNPLQKRDIRRLEDALGIWLDQTKGYDP